MPPPVGALLPRNRLIGVKDAFRTGEIERIEFYGPAQDCHLRWTDDVRTMYHLNYYRSALILRLHGVVRLPDS